MPSLNPRLVTFAAGASGPWRVAQLTAVCGPALPWADRLTMGVAAPPSDAVWVLRGATSHQRYTTATEQEALAARQVAPGRTAARCAALIPIRKSADWWALPQDRRREIFEERSHHTRLGLAYLPAIARRLHHCRDLSTAEPFDFLTWFDFAPDDAAAFDALLAALRGTEEWRYVEHEVEIRLIRDEG